MGLKFGPISYGAHGHDSQSVGTVNGQVVVRITKSQNHTYTNSGIYSVEVLGKPLGRSFRYIEEARSAGYQEYARRSAGASR